MLRSLSRAVRLRKTSAVELVERCIQRVEADHLNLNAVVALRANEALEEAATLDTRIARGEDLGPLAGIPFLVKDIEGVAGMRTTHGSRMFQHREPSPQDGLIASRLRSAGAIPVGKTNTSEFATEGFTGNDVFGVTRNPWAPDWSPGGSSGGSGAAVAAGFAPVATATDTGGSVRCPAAFCGLVGLKPTNTVVPPDPTLPWPDLTTCGPLGVSVDDTRLLLEVMGSLPLNGTRIRREPPPVARPLPLLIRAAPRFTPWGPLPSAVNTAFEDALSGLERALGVPVEPLQPNQIFKLGNPDRDWFILAGPELVEWIGRPNVVDDMDQFYPTTRGFLAEGLKTSFDDYLAARTRRVGYVGELDDLLEDGAIIASPTIASEGWLPEGPRPGVDESAPDAEVYNCIVQNMTGHPAVTVPAGLLSNGIPFGLQFTGPRHGDAFLLDLAELWEEAYPWALVAPGHEPFWG